MKKVFSQDQIPEIAKAVIEYISKHKNKEHATIVALSGDLGVGKTTLTKEIAKLLGIKERVISPTFILRKSYKLTKKGWKQFHHIDAYRLESPKEASRIDWGILAGDVGNVIFLEWPERLEDLLPKKHILVKLTHKTEAKREIVLK